MVTKMTIDAAKQLTMDTRAVLHEFKNLHKTLDFVKEICTFPQLFDSIRLSSLGLLFSQGDWN